MRLVSFLNRRAFRFIRRQKLIRQLNRHGFALFFAGKIPQPAQRQRIPPGPGHLNRDLIGCATDTPRFQFQTRPDIIDSLVKDFQAALFVSFLFQNIQRTVNDFFRDGLLPFHHQCVDKLRHQSAIIFRVSHDFAFVCFSSSHYFSLLVPYFDRDRFRLATPVVSNVPLTI